MHLQLSTADRIVWWKPRAVEEDKSVTDSQNYLVLSGPWEEYEPHKLRERALLRKNPLISPHGFFRSLATDNAGHAIEFAKKFGPLGDLPGPRHGSVRFGLAWFWAQQLRFQLISNLWESRNDPKQLESAWKDIAKHRCQAEWWQGPLQLPWDSADIPSKRREAVFTLVRGELDLHTAGRTTTWVRYDGGFKPMLKAKGLLFMIWEFFGLDTATTEWRRCPHCQRLFYPKRRDQFYCTPRQQALASKRAYAARRRAEEKSK